MSKKKNGKTEFVKWLGPVLEALRDLGGSARPKEITQHIGEKYKLPEEILSERYSKSGVLKFQNQLAWARQYLVWEELLEPSKHGVWALSKKGWDTSLTEKQGHDIWYCLEMYAEDDRAIKSKGNERNLEVCSKYSSKFAVPIARGQT